MLHTLSHLTLRREEAELSTDELIKLLRINQHSAIVIDSDRTAKSTALNPTKQRVASECETSGILCWVTAGREIENYIPTDVIASSYAELSAGDCHLRMTRYQKIDTALKTSYQGNWRAKFSYETDKPSFARKFAAAMESIPEQLDLRERVADLVARIRAAR